MGHNSEVSSHPIFMSFSQVDDWSMDPSVLGRHTTNQINHPSSANDTYS